MLPRTLCILSALVALFKFDFSAKPLLMSVTSDLLSRNTLFVPVLESFEMITGITCKKVCDLTK